MYSLGPRFPEHFIKDDSLVGPTSYFVSDIECKCKESTYPFTAKSRRFKLIKPSVEPSPAHYYPKYRKHRIVGGKSLQYTTPRICMVPKKYLSTHSFEQHFTRCKVYESKTSTTGQRSAFKNWFKCRKSEVSETTTKLIRHVSTSIPLPQYLTFPGETSKATLKYKGSKWSGYTGERKGLTSSQDTPGPGAYDIEPEKKFRPSIRPPYYEEKDLERIRCPTSMDTTQPAFQDPQEVIQTSHYFDGTCDYLYKKVSHNKGPTLWNKAERFTYSTNDNPPPWAYTLEKVQCVRKIIKIVPFACCSPRFKIPSKSDLSPASYNQEYGTIKENSCKLLPRFRGTLVAPFGSTTPRLTPITPESFDDDEEEEEQPDFLKVSQLIPPSEDCHEKEVEVAKSEDSEDQDRYQVVGTSLVLRDILDTEPSLVDMRDVYKKIKEKKSHRVRVENEGFLTTAADRTSWVIAKTTAHDIDWANIDDVKISGATIKMDCPVYNKSPKANQDNSVYYDIHPRYSSSVYKSTHNYRLKNDFEIEKTYENPDNVKTILKCFMPKEILYA